MDSKGSRRLAVPKSAHVDPGQGPGGANGGSDGPAGKPKNGNAVKPQSGGYAATPTTPPAKPAAATASAGGLLLADRIKQARAKGYEGDPCSTCGQLTLVRSGACAKCDTCGETSGCS